MIFISFKSLFIYIYSYSAIINGDYISLKEHPQLLYLENLEYPKDFSKDCVATLIEKNVALTIADCVTDYQNNVYKKINILSYGNERMSIKPYKKIELENGLVESIEVLKIVKHPKYIKGMVSNNIAVIILKKNIYTKIKFKISRRPYTIEEAYSYAWGLTSLSKQTYSNILKRVSISSITLKNYYAIFKSPCGIFRARLKNASRLGYGDGGAPMINKNNMILGLASVPKLGCHKSLYFIMINGYYKFISNVLFEYGYKKYIKNKF